MSTVALMVAGPRLRQVAIVARDGAAVSGELRETFGWPDPFHDVGVGQFGLTNSVFEAGDTFIEVVSPAQPDSSAGRYLERRGCDGGYMAIFQVPDLDEARRRVNKIGVRVVWSVDLPDMATSHLHPKDVPGAIVSLDWADPDDSWRWAGPRWVGGAPSSRAAGGIRSISVAVDDPDAVARRWAAVLGLEAVSSDGGTTVIRLDGADQTVRFVAAGAGATGIAAITISDLNRSEPIAIGGVEISSEGKP
jgi:hypothetical protein